VPDALFVFGISVFSSIVAVTCVTPVFVKWWVCTFVALCTVAFRWDEYSILVVSSCGRCWCVSFYPFGFLVFIAELPTLSRESNLQHLPGGESVSREVNASWLLSLAAG